MPRAARLPKPLSRRSAPYSVSASTAIAPAPAMAYPSTASVLPPASDRQHPGTWAPEEDNILMRLRAQNFNWGPIATGHFPTKTPNACRKRHERLMEKQRSNDNWDAVKLETLAREYMEVREQMWRILADRVDEKWQIVEAKCMERGLKTLQTANRTASRRSRRPSGGTDNAYDDGSGGQYPSRPDQARPNQDEEDDTFNDSAIDPGSDHHGFHSSSIEHQHPYTPINHDQALYPAGTITPTYSSSSLSYPSTLISSPYQIIPQPSPHQQPERLPSFSSTFGPATIPTTQSVINRHSPPHHP